MTSESEEKSLGNSQGSDVPIDPNISPLNPPMMTSDFSSSLTCYAS